MTGVAVDNFDVHMYILGDLVNYLETVSMF